MKDNILNSALIVFAFGAILAITIDGARSTPQLSTTQAESMAQIEPTAVAMRRAPAELILVASATQ